MSRAIHISGVVCAFLAGVILLAAGIAYSASSAADPIPGGRLITWGIMALAGAMIATLDGARAIPQLGIWRIGAKFQGLSDLAVIIIIVIFGAGFAVSLAF